jgi:redox-sensitive bicupin YhaK (pirin superfamily)
LNSTNPQTYFSLGFVYHLSGNVNKSISYYHKSLKYKQLRKGNGVYIFVIKGSIEVEGQTLNLRDGLAVEKFETLNLAATGDSEILLMEVPL